MRLTLAPLALLPAFSFGQATADTMMSQGLYRLGKVERLTLNCAGTEWRKDRRVPVSATVSLLFQPEANLIKLELQSYDNDVLTTRIAADGHTLWTYDLRTKTYASYPYSSETGELLKTWKQRVFQSLQSRTNGMASFAARWLDDAFGTGTARTQWRPWKPLAEVSVADQTILATGKTPRNNTAWYRFAGSEVQGFDLMNLGYQEGDAPDDKFALDWWVDVLPNQIPDTANFGFVPPRGSKPVASESVGG